jgi:predicted Zn-dependent peptidase
MSVRSFRLLTGSGIALSLMLAAQTGHTANMAEHSIRTTIAGIDVIEYPTEFKNVVTITASLPAGNSFATKNISLATLTCSLLDKGTSTQDKFAIASELDRRGALVNFTVGPDFLTIQARTLKADLPLVLRVIADELRHPAISP